MNDLTCAQSIALAFNDISQGGSSDKVYYLNLSETSEGWTVACQYGRRGSALTSQVKGRGLIYDSAKKKYDKIVREKMAKGYRLEGVAPAAQVAPSSGAALADIKPPELLEEILNGDHLKYVTDDAYWMQDKSDGVSKGVLKQAGEIFGINKLGNPGPLPAELVEELARLPLDTFQIDAELVGGKLVCRDLLVADGDISQMPYDTRFPRLCDLLMQHPSKLVVPVATWDGEDKAKALADLKAARHEGVVFKLRSAPYRPGRNGQHKKYKFIKTLSAIAGRPGATGKESVELFLIDANDKGPHRALDGSSSLPCRVRCGTVSLIGKPAVKEGDVVEVAYLYAQASGLLSQARLLHVRTDVEPDECTTAQLIFKRTEAE